MKITKVINNSFVCAYDSNNKEVVVMGKGIGFKAKEGDIVSKKRIEKIFIMDDKSSVDKFKQLLEKLPLEHFRLSYEIISYARRTLGQKLNENIYITLTDHINFAVKRFKKGMMFPNPLLWEVKQFYKSEYLIGEYALRLIKEKLEIEMNEDEAASIALHIVNAEYNTNMNDALKITTLISDIVKIINDFYRIKLDEESLHYSRLITHLKFLSQRLFLNETIKDTDDILVDMITSRYEKEFECSLRIKEYIEKKYEHEVSREELAYLAVHIKRVSMYAEDL
ncbi:BglG family transcription antiterminator LicT [Terrisporobacter mayombei]|uniref:Transcription antiterminator LicT n=1 Tax=Terrisporobacter mayombei TaxID=1541 RepID=A0ABY9Q242_9FIRM|nr:PRD domain-containing protein [Terrisporobacter mayombei]MCC3867401.1 PRD domain-containing protein [Terrisporobacter mayombei]WMT81661.1 Transcription antiterminator LicT [Terrisporobacter mayombei]